MISIIGAGPAGNFLAYLLAKKGYDVKIYEEHRKIGYPVRCTGVLTSSIEKIIKVNKNSIVNKIAEAKIISPNKSELNIKLKKKNLVLDRACFDISLAELAQKNGAKYLLNSRFSNYSQNNGKIKMKINNKIIKTDILIGADGPFSEVAKSASLFSNRRFIAGIQARVYSKSNPSIFEVYLTKAGFSWYVPENESIGRLGICTYKNAVMHFNKLVKEKNARIIEYQSGMIPIYNPNIITKKGNVFLIGDAATQVKALTYGGIIPGLIAAEELSKSFKNYDKNWKKRIGKELWLNLYLRRVMDKFKDSDYDYLISLFKKEHIKEIVEMHDRDFPSQFLFKLLFREPRLLKFAKFI